MGAPKLPLQSDEILFLMNNFNSLTNSELSEHINSLRSEKNQLTVSGLRHRCTSLGLSRSIQIRWSKSDIKKLKKWYAIIGDTEISNMLNEVGNSKRRINGKIIKRIFTKKHVEKKRRLLGLSRTKEQISKIRIDNKLCGNLKDFTSIDNLYTRGVKPVAKEQDTRVWKGRRYIKIDSKFIPYTRWYYNNYIAIVPDDMIVFHKDMDSLNDEQENLEIRKKRKLNERDYLKSISLLEKRIELLRPEISDNWNDNLKPKERGEGLKEIYRLESLVKKIKGYIPNKGIKETGFYEHIEAF